MRKLSIALVAITALALAGCQTTTPTPTVTKLQVVDIPADLYNCPIINKFPEYQNLTERQVSKLIVTLYQNNITCKNSVDSIRKFITKAKLTIN